MIRVVLYLQINTVKFHLSCHSCFAKKTKCNIWSLSSWKLVLPMQLLDIRIWNSLCLSNLTWWTKPLVIMCAQACGFKSSLPFRKLTTTWDFPFNPLKFCISSFNRKWKRLDDVTVLESRVFLYLFVKEDVKEGIDKLLHWVGHVRRCLAEPDQGQTPLQSRLTTKI